MPITEGPDQAMAAAGSRAYGRGMTLLHTGAAVDPRIAAVEHNLLSQLDHFVHASVVTPLDVAGVTAYRSEVAFPLFNAIGGARFADAPDVDRRVEALVAEFTRRGLPFLWWPTPSTTSPALEAALVARGLVREEVTGMHLDLHAPGAPILPEGVRVRRDPPLTEFTAAMAEAFGMPLWVVAPMAVLLGSVPDEQLHNVLLQDGDRLLGCGSLYLTGTVAGLYDIATVERFRGHGVGQAMTALLLDLAHRLGATRAILHATPMGVPVYRRAGFEAVCPIPQYLWLPD